MQNEKRAKGKIWGILTFKGKQKNKILQGVTKKEQYGKLEWNHVKGGKPRCYKSQKSELENFARYELLNEIVPYYPI